MQKKVFFENLDGLRFFSFFIVFFYHATHSEPFLLTASPFYRNIICGITGNGNLGVNFFFVLSGFLITYLLVDEKRSFNTIHVKSFYTRRILRIWPLYFLVVLIGYTLYLPFRLHILHQNTALPPLQYFIFFVSNFYMEAHGAQGYSEVLILNTLWSVAIEEQFYLFWPLLFWLVPPKYYKLSVAGVIVISIASRFYCNHFRFIEYHTLSCMGDLAVGAFGALLVIDEDAVVKKYIKQMPRYGVAIIYLAAMVFYITRDYYYDWIKPIWPIERSIIAIVFLLIILEQNYCEQSFFKLSKFKKISFLGTQTYGLYILHVFAIIFFTAITRQLFFKFGISLWALMIVDIVGAYLLSTFLANLSYNYFEKPFLKLKNKYGYITQK